MVRRGKGGISAGSHRNENQEGRKNTSLFSGGKGREGGRRISSDGRMIEKGKENRLNPEEGPYVKESNMKVFSTLRG